MNGDAMGALVVCRWCRLLARTVWTFTRQPGLLFWRQVKGTFTFGSCGTKFNMTTHTMTPLWDV